MNWIKRHKFWVVAIILFLYAVLSAAFLGSDPTPVSNFIALYVIIGYPVKWLYCHLRERSHKVVREANNANK